GRRAASWSPSRNRPIHVVTEWPFHTPLPPPVSGGGGSIPLPVRSRQSGRCRPDFISIFMSAFRGVSTGTSERRPEAPPRSLAKSSRPAEWILRLAHFCRRSQRERRAQRLSPRLGSKVVGVTSKAPGRLFRRPTMSRFPWLRSLLSSRPSRRQPRRRVTLG